MSKICVICGSDCSTRPRTKDRKGRYFCQGCYEEAVHRKRNAMPERDDIGGVDIFAIAAPAVGGGKVCPNCDAAMVEEAIVCMSCGYSTSQGTTLQTKSRRAAQSTWPLVIGLISALGGTAQLVLRGLDFVLIPEVAMQPENIAKSVFGFLVTLALLFGGIMVMRRNPRGVRWLQNWARVIAVFGTIGMIGLGIALGATQRDFLDLDQLQLNAEQYKATIIISMLLLGLSMAYAIFLLVWFRRGPIKSEVESWS